MISKSKTQLIKKLIRFNSSLSLLNGTSRQYVDLLYQTWLKNPQSVDPSWNKFFSDQEQLDFSNPNVHGSTFVRDHSSLVRNDLIYKVTLMVEKFRTHGHYIAKLDPLDIYFSSQINRVYNSKNFTLESFGLSTSDIKANLELGEMVFLGDKVLSIEHLHSRLMDIYCKNVGFEFGHIENKDEKLWLRQKIESNEFFKPDKNEQMIVLDRLAWSTEFENFLGLKWAAAKRFGIEGTESMIPGIKTIIDTATDLGVKNVVIGMPHRGRLNVLANVLRKPMDQIFAEFRGEEKGTRLGTGDVKYHWGCSHNRTTRNGKSVHISLVANPSHLESCNTVVLGKARAKQDYSNDKKLLCTLPIIMHGDASFYGQGIVYETLMMSDFIGFKTGGVVHVICNNQLGYTTDPLYTRSAKYCTNVARSFGAPIFHVNAEHPDAVVGVCKMAAEFRMRFKKDVVIDVVGFRKFGHNEADEPRFTQPLMYSKIDQKSDHLSIYTEKLKREKIATEDEIKAVYEKVRNNLQENFEASHHFVQNKADWLDANWQGFHGEEKISKLQMTGAPLDMLRKVGNALVALPVDFQVHKRIQNVINARGKAMESGRNIDWGLAEGLAFGSLLLEGSHVRLSGQDVERGTFSHRHSVLVNQTPKYPHETYVPLHNLKGAKGVFTVLNSPLSEYGVLGYEYGYSLESPHCLVIWEAQFGDFSNLAQVIFDQFISSSETKWLRQSGIVVMLPHAYEGGGPEHSSARMERFLQMCCDDPDNYPETDAEIQSQIQKCNWQVLNCSTPANYFHSLRRQMHRNFRKPMILFSPKSLLKLKECTSSLEEFAENTKFLNVIPERENILVKNEKVRKVVFCSGKFYFDLVKERNLRKINDVAVVSLEQISPFPYYELKLELNKYSRASVTWAQEEPQNMGAYTYVQPRLRTLLRKMDRPENIEYAGRAPSAATATGFGMKEHIKEMKMALEMALK